MKRYLAFLIAVILCLSLLTGCGNDAPEVEGEADVELSLWYCRDCPAADAVTELAERYTELRPTTRIKCRSFKSESELLSAAEKSLPDMVLCSNTAASVISENVELWDVSTLFGGISPDIVDIYGRGYIGKSFFPFCYSPDLLCVSSAAGVDISALSSLDGLVAAAKQYAQVNSAPFLCFDTLSGYFNTASAQKAQLFTGVRDADVENDGFVEAYNALAECYIAGGLTFSEDTLEALRKGEAVCGYVPGYKLTDAEDIELLPPCVISGGSRVYSSTAYGISVTASNDETAIRMFDFMRWAYGSENNASASLCSGCVPAVVGLELTAETPLEAVLKQLYDEYSAALIGYTYSDYVNQLGFDDWCMKALEILR